MEERPRRILIVGEDPDERRGLRSLLALGFGSQAEILEAGGRREAEAAQSESEVDATLLDYKLWEGAGRELLRLAHSSGSSSAFLILSDGADAAAAFETPKLGVSGCLLKENLSAEHLRAAIDCAIATKEKDRRRDEAEAALRQENRALLERVVELQRQGCHHSLLNEMIGQLQICLSLEEAYRSIAMTAESLFPESSGALAIFNDSRNLLEPVARWGRVGLDREPITFAPAQCRALMRGRSYHLPEIGAGLRCQHLRAESSGRSLCVPLVAQGQTLGVLVLEWHDERAADGGELSGQPPESLPLAESLAEHAALAIANLRLRQTLQVQSVRDPLTNLFNRRYMEETLEREICSALRRGRPLSVMMIDFDHFKTFNDSFGHDVGDLVLRELARFLQSRTRGEDAVCRYGGEEFVLILPEAGLADSVKRAEQLREEFKTLRYLTGVEKAATVTLSIGVASFPDHGRGSQALLLHADRGLYLAKSGGRDRVAVATDPAAPAARRATDARPAG